MEMTIQGGSTLELSDAVFACDYNEGLVHQVVTSYMTTGRAGTRAQKNRSAVSGGGAKPWAQKGTGRARAGTSRGPLWRKGGVTFAAVPKDYTQKINRKMYRAAMRSIVSTLIAQGRMVGCESLQVDAPRTKKAVELIQSLELQGQSVLMVTAEQDDVLLLATRNLPRVEVYSASQLNPVVLVGYEKILISADALRKLQEVLS